MKTLIITAILLTTLTLVSGNVCTYYRLQGRTSSVPSGLFGLWRTAVTRYYTVSEQRCCGGWSGDVQTECTTPVCSTPCYNGGTCIAPDTCKCPTGYTCPHCEQLECSHLSPCYPGACRRPNYCTCWKGYAGESCLYFTDDNHLPIIESCEITLANVRRSDNRQLFNYTSFCAARNGSNTVWMNQQLFNYVKLGMSNSYQPLDYTPPRPSYVSASGFGIVANSVLMLHRKIDRANKTNSFIALDKNYTCSDVSSKSPQENSNCVQIDENYKINIEHGDVLTVTYQTMSGGYRDLQNNNVFYATQFYIGRPTSKVIEFRFDFIAPVHCSEVNSTRKCNAGEKPLHIARDITNTSISPTSNGWSDELSGLDYYYLEVFKLEPNIYGELTEVSPLSPKFKYTTTNTSNDFIQFPSYTPDDPGMYSVLLQASDKANNSKITRRLVLYDNKSTINLTKPGMSIRVPDINDISEMIRGDGGLYVISAVPETGYMWQTTKNGSLTRIVVNWQNHFVNKMHEDNKLLGTVLPYPTQFQDLQDDGILRSQKYVTLDDHEGERDCTAIPNMHGIIKFEVKRVFTDDKQEPRDGWEAHTLTEQYEVSEKLDDGSHVKLWIRATDVMGHTKADYAEVHIDNSPPRLQDEKFTRNIINGTYQYTSRVTFLASDDQSGVHKIIYSLITDNNTNAIRTSSVLANRNNASGACDANGDARCHCVLNQCFLSDQTLDLDNCWFIVPKDDLNKSARLILNVYNQALLYKTTTFNISRLSELHGLEEYSGPTNIRVDKSFANGIRLLWDLPKAASCYGRVDIDVVLYSANGKSLIVKRVNSEESSVDLIGLNPDEQYSVSLNLGYQGTALASLPYSFKTAPMQNYLAGGAIAGIVVGVLVIIGLLIAIFVVLLRRGHMQPVRRGLRAMTVMHRRSVVGKKTNDYSAGAHRSNTNSLYMYGEIDFNDVKSIHLSRDDIVLDNLLKSGNFADIYKATIRSTNTTVVAKTLKSGYTQADEYLMKAKIKFSAALVGPHDNVLKFIGAVISDTNIGPFMIFEYCSNGQLTEYLQTIKSNVTVEIQEHLYRIGLGIARGMEYLAQKQIVHRRLAARNVLLSSCLSPKLTGFGPQPDETEKNLAVANKRERIPIKWMAPECLKSTVDATEKSDVWSYGIVLWEIFSLGGKPYDNISGRDLPSKLKDGYRLPKPEMCDDKWYGVMKKTWVVLPEKRPTFKEIRGELDEMFVSAPVDDYYYYRT